jgi:hypothetical protein
MTLTTHFHLAPGKMSGVLSILSLYGVIAYTGTTLLLSFNYKWSGEQLVCCVEFSNIPHVSLEQRTVLW